MATQNTANTSAAPQDQTPVPFEVTLVQALSTAKENNMMPVWQHFLNSDFFIAVTPKEKGPINEAYDFAVFQSPQQAEPFVVVSQYAEKLNPHEGQQAIRVTGGNLVHLLNPKHSVVVALSQNTFTLPTDLLGWLRSHTQFVAAS